jgi:hypothetical protein
MALESPICLLRVKLRPRPTCPACSVLPPAVDIIRQHAQVRLVPILLQKSKVASARIFGETLKREAIDDSDDLSRITEVAYKFSVRR